MKRFNIIDVIIVVVILLAVAAAVVLKSGNGMEGELNTKTVTLELAEKRVGFSENVVVGDKVTEKVKKVQIGKVTGVEARPAEKNSYDRTTGEGTVINIPEREDVYVNNKAFFGQRICCGCVRCKLTGGVWLYEVY